MARKLVFSQMQQIGEEGMQSVIVQNGLAFETVNTLAAVHDKLPQAFEESQRDFEMENESNDFINQTVVQDNIQTQEENQEIVY
jgi:hypothetical protein